MTDQPTITFIRPALGPLEPPEGRHNFKTLAVVQPDGSIVERVLLDVPDPSHRELLICLHYIQNCARIFELTDQFEIHDREDPWDFRITSPDGAVSHVEITAIADSEKRFKHLINEERLRLWSEREEIPIHQLIKLERMFYLDGVNDVIEALIKAGSRKTDIVPNPLYRQGDHIMWGGEIVSDGPLSKKLSDAITTKENKKKGLEGDTALIIDNRTVLCDLDDFRQAFDEIEEVVAASPFGEIWVYTGYFSEDDGSGAEFAFNLLKTKAPRTDRLPALHEREVDDAGRMIWHPEPTPSLDAADPNCS